MDEKKRNYKELVILFLGQIYFTNALQIKKNFSYLFLHFFWHMWIFNYFMKVIFTNTKTCFIYFIEPFYIYWTNYNSCFITSSHSTCRYLVFTKTDMIIRAFINHEYKKLIILYNP